MKKTLSFLALSLGCLSFANADDYEVVNRQAIDRVWSGNYVGFDILMSGQHQYVAYYDANRQMTVAHREASAPWVYYKVDSWYGWDSHNYITIELDTEGHLHLFGNMHAQRMEYFRTRFPHDVRTLERIHVLENAELEKVSTYPKFLKRDNGELILKYRSGFSGDGVEVYLAYDPESQAWTQIHDTPLIDGQGLMNAYVEGPSLGPDGRFHMVWIWRDTPDAGTNHDISYARSDDLIHWEDSAGNPLPLPITLASSDIADPVPARGGAINGNNKLGFDSQHRPLIAFHKYDQNGQTQAYIARREADAWKSYQVSDWRNFRWDFGGTGSLSSFDVRIQKPVALPDGKIRLTVKKQEDWYDLILDEASLKLLESRPSFAYPPVLSQVASSGEVLLNGVDSYGDELILRTKSAQGDDGLSYYITWEAQAPFRGQARESILPPSTLYLHTLKQKKAD
ncbi:BNR repeat-containing protein [Pelagicoccus sp. SDUM812005]|uniref:BNR repeat-containing protein n=1 Tax=Pelagicoccus sp. SDUM812005 TaxID=3041257 RepID=UPI00280EF871|nr:BNR repeat-containing protein [Pelagicoccus sp. SDUM812005]MDQ8183606.1 BNR repeat-containing protein [Pelagicoccus sp. SDUM812005]